MRDILFRAKRVKDGKWVEGFYSYRAFEGKLDHIIFQPAIAEYDYTEWGYLVDPTTVGQYTGLTDKNGKKIFEGDIVKAYSAYFNGIGYIEHEFIKPVTYDCGGFFLGSCDDDSEGWLGDYSIPFDENQDYIQALGNIHDNPELLKGDNNHDD